MQNASSEPDFRQRQHQEGRNSITHKLVGADAPLLAFALRIHASKLMQYKGNKFKCKTKKYHNFDENFNGLFVKSQL